MSRVNIPIGRIIGNKSVTGEIEMPRDARSTTKAAWKKVDNSLLFECYVTSELGKGGYKKDLGSVWSYMRV